MFLGLATYYFNIINKTTSIYSVHIPYALNDDMEELTAVTHDSLRNIYKMPNYDIGCLQTLYI